MGGSLKQVLREVEGRSLGMASTIPKAFGFEAATCSKAQN